jgi:hypothetical protein
MDKGNPFVGRWTYRSFHNDPELSKEFNELRCGAGTLVLDEPENPFALRFQGSGDIGGERWVYDYVGYLVPIWPNGVDQSAAIAGSVIRTIPHSNGQARAGYVASFIAVKQVWG